MLAVSSQMRRTSGHCQETRVSVWGLHWGFHWGFHWGSHWWSARECGAHLAVEAAAALVGARGGQQLLERVGKVKLVHGIGHAGALGLGALDGLARVGVDGAALGRKGARPRVAKEALARARVERRLHDGREAVEHHGKVREDEHVGDNVGPPEAPFLDTLQLLVPSRGREEVDDAQEQVDGGKETGEGDLGEKLRGKQRGRCMCVCACACVWLGTGSSGYAVR